MTQFHCVAAGQLEGFLARRWSDLGQQVEPNLAEHFVEVLRRANEFVPSEAGSILLDNSQREGQGEGLRFIAAFGTKSDRIVGRTNPIDAGIAGHVYSSGRSFRSKNLSEEAMFNSAFDRENEYTTKSLVAIPIRVESEVCGVLELLNRKQIGEFTSEDLVLLEIFADYLSVSIRNVLDARRAREIARRDNLTGLLNDRSLHPLLGKMIEDCHDDGSDLSLLFIDLDYFKQVNDSHGHLTGSQVLREVGSILNGICEPIGAVGARYGGDEFVVARPGASLDVGIDLAELIRTELAAATYCAQPTALQSEVVNLRGVTCSIGVASLRRHTADDQEIEQRKGTLLRLADAAMYVAKETGRNRTAIAGEVVIPRTPATPPQRR